MKKNTTFLAALALSMVTATAGVAPAPTGKGVAAPPPVDPCAGPISYNSVSLFYLHSDIDGLDGDLDGVSLRFERSLAPNFYLAASGDYSSGSNTDLWNVRLGVGAHMALTENIDLVGEVGGAYFDAQTEFDRKITARGSMDYGHYTVGDSDWGWYVRPHLRAKFGCLEIHAGAEYQDAYENNWAFFGELYYQVSPGWDVAVGAREGDDSTQWSAGVRYRY